MRTFPFLLAALLLVGCHWTADGAQRLEELYPSEPSSIIPTQDVQEPVDVSYEDSDTAEPEEVIEASLEGTWAVRIISRGTISPIGTPWDLTTTDLFLGTISPEEDLLTLTFCSQENLVDQGTGPSDFGRAEVPPALFGALHASPLVIELPDAAFDGAVGVWLWGLRDMENSISDPLPQEETDERVYDQDGDGHAGITMNIALPKGDRYMVRRTVWSFKKGKFLGTEDIHGGRLAFVTHEKAYGASNTLLTTVADITPIDNASVYHLVRVSSEMGCDEIIQGNEQLFEGL